MPAFPNGLRRARLLGVLAVAVVVPLVTLTVVRDGDGRDRHFVRWRDGTLHGSWRAVFDGHGTSGAEGEVISLRPQPPAAAAETHAGLVVSKDFHEDMQLTLRTRTIDQLRDRPNPWEVSWIVWGYSDEHHFYYLAVKPNGWELGKRDPAYQGGQRFLATGSPAFSPGPWYEVKVVHHGATMSVDVNGRHLTTYTDDERPYLRGAVGLYTEDAHVEFTDIKVEPR